MFAHVDADAFFASALQRKRPELRGKPLLALGMGGGCVIAASYEAKAFGVKTGMPLRDARKLCPQAIAVPSDFDEALSASRQIEEILSRVCPLMEQYSVDEWFLDLKSFVGGVPSPLESSLRSLSTDVARSTGLTVSIGAAPSRLLAKMASEYRKPAGVTVMDAGGIEIFLRDRPAAAVPGIGRRRTLHAEARGWKTAWDFAVADSEAVLRLFGRPGIDLQEELLGNPIEGIATEDAPPKSISRCRSFPKTKDRDIALSHLMHHLTYTVLKMRREGLACRMVSVWLRDGEYEGDQKISKLPEPMANEEQLLPYVLQCFDRLYEPGKPCTQVGLALLNLNPKGGTQYSLFEETKRTDGAEKIQETLDSLHERFGRESVKRGAAMATAGAAKQHLNMIE